MADLLDKMDPDKKLRLINAAMKEFGENRFDKASTNVIVNEAGISKGLLYHYFSSKEELYNYLFEYAIKAVAVPVAEKVGFEDGDILRRMEKIVRLKMEILHELPALLPFSKVMYAGMDYEEVKKSVAKYNPIPLEMYYSHNVDASLFKEGVDVGMAVRIIQMTLEKIGEGYMIQRNMGIETDIDVMIAELDKYLSHFRRLYYKVSDPSEG